MSDPVWVKSLPPYEPIDWTDENAALFLNGAMKVEMMTRGEFERRYPTVRNVVGSITITPPLPEPDDTGI